LLHRILLFSASSTPAAALRMSLKARRVHLPNNYLSNLVQNTGAVAASAYGLLSLNVARKTEPYDLEIDEWLPEETCLLGGVSF
jgi:hypothetical protein